jgi:hypothetical protein
MATTPIKFPALPTGLTLTCDVVHPSTLAVEETVTLTEASSIYSGIVTGKSVVMAMFGLPDNVPTMTRSTTAIDVASGITWSGNYVESPAVHHSSALDLDGGADLGHRFVASGATATLRMSSTNDLAQNGAVLFVVQGVTGTPPSPSDSGSFLPFFYP